MKKNIFPSLLSFAAVLLLLGAGCTKQQPPAEAPVSVALPPVQAENETSVTSFETCVKAGNKVESGTPNRCMHDGKYYNEASLFGFSAIFSNKIVYNTAPTTKADAEKDCKERSGMFKECGSPCAPGAEACVEMCVFTCEIPLELGQERYRPDLDFTIPNQKNRISQILAQSEEQQSGDLVKDATFAPVEIVSRPGSLTPVSGTHKYTVRGMARGQWFFAGSASVALYDQQGKLIGSGSYPVQPEKVSTTNEFVPFVGEMSYFETSFPKGKATLVLGKINPLTLPRNEKEVLLEVSL